MNMEPSAGCTALFKTRCRGALSGTEGAHIHLSEVTVICKMRGVAGRAVSNPGFSHLGAM